MRTANTTSRLGLMEPVDSDTFTSSDFSDTFNILDGQPGILPVASYNAMTSLNWGSAQYGTIVITTNNNAMWKWGSAGGGTFQRVNSVGLITQAQQFVDVSTRATSGFGVKVLSTGNITVPGGRALHINVQVGLDSTQGLDGMCGLNLRDNGNTLIFAGFRPGRHYFTGGQGCTLDWYIPNPAPNSVHNFDLGVRASDAPTSLGGGGTSTARGGVLTVVEI